MPAAAAAAAVETAEEPPRQHGVKGVYCGGDWLDIEDCHFNVDDTSHETGEPTRCPRSRSRRSAAKATIATTTSAGVTTTTANVGVYDVCIVGAGCIGAAVARELCRSYSLSVLWVEAADDVSQGATKGNSGIVHAGYDDQPGSVRAQHCWRGNQMFAQLDRELHFGYQKNGSLVLAFTAAEQAELEQLKMRGERNGVQRLRIVDDLAELRAMEPHVNPAAIAALYAPDAGNVVPYEFAVALAENAVDNGVELRIRTSVTAIDQNHSNDGDGDRTFTVHLEHWEPAEYLQAVAAESHRSSGWHRAVQVGSLVTGALVAAHYAALQLLGTVGTGGTGGSAVDPRYHVTALVLLSVICAAVGLTPSVSAQKPPPVKAVSRSTPLRQLVEEAGAPAGRGGTRVTVDDMLRGGSGSAHVQRGKAVNTSQIRCSYVINCAGGAADEIAGMIGDRSFKIKPRLGDYILLNRNQGHLAKHTLFPCPDPVLGKGVLVQTTLWGNLILGPTARDTYKPEARDMSAAAVQEYILSQCKKLVPSFDPKETIHAFCGARAKSDRGDWIIEQSKVNPNFIHVAGIDSPGLAGAPSIALKVVDLLREAGLKAPPNPNFNPSRAPIITPKNGMKGLKMGPVGKFDSDGTNTEQMAANVICKCEKVTELEVVRAMRRSLPIDSSQAIRKRTRAGMGHCQGDPVNYNCEARVRAIIARENGVPVTHVGGRPWPATSTLSQRWIGDEEKSELEERMKK